MGYRPLFLVLCLGLMTGCTVKTPSTEAQLTRDPTPYELIVLGAKEEVEKGVRYDSSYRPMDYPLGDVPSHLGACTDLVIRALRRAGYDLQRLIHEDMHAAPDEYPNLWGHSRPDPNIDHRRIPNQMAFLRRHAQVLNLSAEDPSDWQQGDIVYWKFPDGSDHCGIISDRTNRRGIPLVIHNSWLAVEEDCLARWEIIGHFRYPPQCP